LPAAAAEEEAGEEDCVISPRSKAAAAAEAAEGACAPRAAGASAALPPPPLATVRKPRSDARAQPRSLLPSLSLGPGGSGGPPCDNCGALESPQWRKGPPDKPRLCNACGARYLRTRALAAPDAAPPPLPPPPPPPLAIAYASPLPQRAAAAATPPPVFSPGGAAGVLMSLFGEAAPPATAAPAAPPPRRSSRATLEFAPPAAAPAAAPPAPKRRAAEAAEGEAARMARPPPPPPPSVPRAQKAHRPWSAAEVGALVDGVAVFGRGQWADIKALPAVAATLAQRSSVDLKDKWRNLSRVAALQGEGEAEAAPRRREAAEGVPPELLARVRALSAAAPPAAASTEGSPDPGLSSLGSKRSKRHSPWSVDESWALVEGVAAAAGCHWTRVKALPARLSGPLAQRTAMDLKDKWRNLLALAQLPAASRRKSDAPAALLDRILELEELYGAARRRGRRSPSEPSDEA